ncbi:MAG: hypothetical protein JO037_02785 [Actinobacteria bacterium]|nr:hypothetical protein [Actinomycetota bacterium]
MKRVLALVVMVVVLSCGVTACGSSGKSTQAGTSTSQAASGTATGTPAGAASGTASAASGSCASAGTRKIPKTRLVADLALTYGAFHRYLYKPYKAGSFAKGANGRTKAIIKAALASAAIIKLLSNARDNAAADPTLCKFVPNMDSIKSSLSDLTGKIKGGTATDGDVNSTSNLFDQLKNGAGFTPPANGSLPGLG